MCICRAIDVYTELKIDWPSEDTYETSGELANFTKVTTLRWANGQRFHVDEEVYLLPWLPKGPIPHIRNLEIRNDPSPCPRMLKWVARRFPNLETLSLVQPGMWCDECERVMINYIQKPYPDKIVYPDASGLSV